jgi:hypothetical protein
MSSNDIIFTDVLTNMYEKLEHESDICTWTKRWYSQYGWLKMFLTHSLIYVLGQFRMI